MPLTLPIRSWTIRREQLRERAAGIVAVLIVHFLGFLLLLSLAPDLVQKITPDVKNFTLLSISDNPAPKVASTSDAPRRKPITKPVTPPLPPPPTPLPSNMIMMSSEDFRASDISKFHGTPAQGASGNGGAGDEVSQGAGDGPGGEKMYAADWYTEPTTAEMSYYLRGKRQAGWGMIACKTAPNFKVVDCQELGEFPNGSGLAGALRQAAWQFKIRPPRIGGKPQMDVWVRILFDFQVGVIKR